MVSYPCFSATIVESDNGDFIVTKSTGEYVLGSSESPAIANKTIIELTKSESANYIGSYIYKEVAISNGELKRDETAFYTLSKGSLISYNDSKAINDNAVVIKYIAKYKYSKSDIKDGIEYVQSNLALKNEFSKLKSEYDDLISKISGSNSGGYEVRGFIFDSFSNNANKAKNLFSTKSVSDVIKISEFNFNVDKKIIDDAFNLLKMNSIFDVGSYEIKPYKERAVAIVKYKIDTPNDLFWEKVSPLFPHLKDDSGRLSKKTASQCNYVPFSVVNNYECKLLEYFDSRTLRVGFKDHSIDEYYYVRLPVAYKFNVDDTMTIYLDSYHTPNLEYEFDVFTRGEEPEQIKKEEDRKNERAKKESSMYACFNDARKC